MTSSRGISEQRAAFGMRTEMVQQAMGVDRSTLAANPLALSPDPVAALRLFFGLFAL
jgi:hypothetical protein